MIDMIIKALDNIMPNETFGHHQMVCKQSVILAIEEVFAEYNNGWILVSERLPKIEESHGEYMSYRKRLLIAYMTDTVEYTVGSYDRYKWLNRNESNIKNVIAWQPLKPYKTDIEV